MNKLLAIVLALLLSSCTQHLCGISIETQNNCTSDIQFNLKNHTNLFDSSRTTSIVIKPQERARIGNVVAFNCKMENALLDDYKMQLVIGNKSISLDRANIINRLTKDTEYSTRDHRVWLLDTSDLCEQLGAATR